MLISFSIFIGCERGTVNPDPVVTEPPKEDTVKAVIIKDTILVTPIGGVLESNSSKRVVQIKVAGYKGWEFANIAVFLRSRYGKNIQRFIPVDGTSFLTDDYNFDFEKHKAREDGPNQNSSFFQPKSFGQTFKGDTSLFYIQVSSGLFPENSYFEIDLVINLRMIVPGQSTIMKSIEYFAERNYPLFALQGSLGEDIAPFGVSKIVGFDHFDGNILLKDISFSIDNFFEGSVYLESFIFELDGTLYNTSEIQKIADVKILQPSSFDIILEGESLEFYIRYTGVKDFSVKQILYSLSKDGEVKKLTVD